MSEPTYRIEIEHKPADPMFTYQAIAYRISDDELACVHSADSATEAVNGVRDKIRLLANAEPPRQPVYVDDDGNLTAAPTPQSLRA